MRSPVWCSGGEELFSLKFIFKRKGTKWWRTRTSRTTQVIPWSLADARRQIRDDLTVPAKKYLSIFEILIIGLGLKSAVVANLATSQKILSQHLWWSSWLFWFEGCRSDADIWDVRRDVIVLRHRGPELRKRLRHRSRNRTQARTDENTFQVC